MPSLAQSAALATARAAVESRPAGGATLGQMIEATLVFAVVLGGVAWYVTRQRRSRGELVDREPGVRGFGMGGARHG